MTGKSCVKNLVRQKYDKNNKVENTECNSDITAIDNEPSEVENDFQSLPGKAKRKGKSKGVCINVANTDRMVRTNPFI